MQGEGVVETRKLAAFAAAYECASLTEAARRSFVSRQALSKTISQVEAETGPLFERTARGVRPTPLADAIYPHVRRILAERDCIAREVERFAAGRAGRLSLAFESNGAMTLPATLKDAYAAARPSLELSTTTLPAELVYEYLASGRVDAVVAGPPCGGSFGFEPIFSSTLSIVFLAGELEGFAPLPDSRPDAQKLARRYPLEALEGKRIFGVSPKNHVERQLAPFLEARGIAAEVTYECSDTALATNRMNEGQGGVIVEESGADDHFGSALYAHVPLTGEDAPYWELGVVFRLGDAAEAAARDFALFAREAVAGTRAPGLDALG